MKLYLETSKTQNSPPNAVPIHPTYRTRQCLDLHKIWMEKNMGQPSWWNCREIYSGTKLTFGNCQTENPHIISFSLIPVSGRRGVFVPRQGVSEAHARTAHRPTRKSLFSSFFLIFLNFKMWDERPDFDRVTPSELENSLRSLGRVFRSSQIKFVPRCLQVHFTCKN